jgi:hypothetical protein
MHRKIHQEHDLNVTRGQVYNVMHALDPQGLDNRGGIGAKKARRKGNFTTNGSKWVDSLDGHDKLTKLPKRDVSIGYLWLPG